MDMVSYGDAPINGGIPYSKITDVYNDCKGLPEPQAPKMTNSLASPGEGLGLECGKLGDSI